MEMSKQLGDTLIVIIDNDEQAKFKKGRAFMDAAERMIVVGALKPVDATFLSIDLDSTVNNSLRALRDLYPLDRLIFTKGGDRTKKDCSEAAVCSELNIEVLDGMGPKIQSSSALIQKAIDAVESKKLHN
jgi:glycerol-3-phosphate cytidylyltransferase-like family protein